MPGTAYPTPAAHQCHPSTASLRSTRASRQSSGICSPCAVPGQMATGLGVWDRNLQTTCNPSAPCELPLQVCHLPPPPGLGRSPACSTEVHPESSSPGTCVSFGKRAHVSPSQSTLCGFPCTRSKACPPGVAAVPPSRPSPSVLSLASTHGRCPGLGAAGPQQSQAEPCTGPASLLPVAHVPLWCSSLDVPTTHPRTQLISAQMRPPVEYKQWHPGHLSIGAALPGTLAHPEGLCHQG